MPQAQQWRRKTSYLVHRLRKAQINSEKTPVLNRCSARRHILCGTRFTVALSASRSQATATRALLLIRVVMLVGLKSSSFEKKSLQD